MSEGGKGRLGKGRIFGLGKNPRTQHFRYKGGLQRLLPSTSKRLLKKTRGVTERKDVLIRKKREKPKIEIRMFQKRQEQTNK